VRLHTRNALVLVLAVTAGCGSSSTSGPARHSDNPDAGEKPEAAPHIADAGPDVSIFVVVDAGADAVSAVDAAIEAPARDVPVPLDLAPLPVVDAFVPGPVEPLVVNSGNTATYDLADGTWKVFSFDTVAGHFYCIGTLDAGIDAYLGLSPSVSPSDYLQKTNYLRALNFTAYDGGKYYVAVAANGGGASGAFQIADGGDLLELGANTVNLTAPDGDKTYFFNFSIAPGHTYAISVAGDAKNPVTLSLSPLADRSTDGRFAFPLSTKTSILPITDEPISLESVVKSTSRLYFFSVKVKEAVSLTITITLSS
jgi:hypothetical protein